MAIDVTGLKSDPSNQGWVLGWAVFRNSPWELSGMYVDEQEAKRAATDLGDAYQAAYGSHRVGSDDFMRI